MSRSWKLGAFVSAFGLVSTAGAAVFTGAAGAAVGAPIGVISAGPAKVTAAGPALTSPALPKSAIINRPTMSLSAYRAIKTAARSSARRPGVAKAPTVPFGVTSTFGFNGIAQPQAQSTWPSDSNGAVLGSQLAENVNSHLTTYNLTGGQTSDRSFATLTGYSTTSLYDPRIISDTTWKRYTTEVDASPQSTSLQNFFLMASKGANGGGAYWVYDINVAPECGAASTNPNWDYPQIGQTQDAVVVTANCFQGNTYVGARTFAVAKSILYNGLGFSTPVFSIATGDGTTTPANVLDQNPKMELLTANVDEVGFQDPQAGFYGSITADTPISGFATPSVPRSAGQAGCTQTSCNLDTSDGRFVNDSTQFGDQLWNVATYGLTGPGTFATPFWGQFSISGASTVQHGDVFADNCSDDWNASLVVSTADKMWINWSSTDPQGSSCGQTFARQEEAGRISTTAANTTSPAINPFTSPAELTGNYDPNFGLQRWGDTSAMVLQTASTAWSVNNSVVDANDWGTRWQKVTQ